jgi:hypothetical protein
VIVRLNPETGEGREVAEALAALRKLSPAVDS